MRLGAVIAGNPKQRQEGFNSSLVRLGVYLNCLSPTRLLNVSIPAWCDWEFFHASPAEVAARVSIPAWCDWERHNRFPPLSPTWVSIPAWCDWESSTLLRALSGLACFNSSLVRLGESSLKTAISLSLSFQFQLGAIGSRFSNFSTINRSNVSIPAWCDWEPTLWV